MIYDYWKLESPEDEYARKNPHLRHSAYTVAVTRQIEATLMVEVEATSEEDAIAKAISDAKAIPFAHWTIGQDDYDASTVDDMHRDR